MAEQVEPVMLNVFILFPNGFWYEERINPDITGEQLRRQVIQHINRSDDERIRLYHRTNILLYMSNLPPPNSQPYHFKKVSAWQLLLNEKKNIPGLILPERTLTNNNVTNQTVINVGFTRYSIKIMFMNGIVEQEIIEPITQRIIDLKTLIMTNQAMIDHIRYAFGINQMRLYILQEDGESILCENNALLSTYHIKSNSVVNIIIQDTDISQEEQERTIEQAKPLLTSVMSPQMIQSLKLLWKNIWYLNLEGSNIGNRGVLVVEQGIVACDSLRSINLERNNIGEIEGAATLARIIKSVPTLYEISIGVNDCNDISEIVRVLPETNIVMFNFSHNNLNEASVNLLLEQVPQTNLFELSIAGNSLRTSSVTKLAELLHDNQLIRLSIYQCGLDTERTTMIAQELSNCPALEYLDIHSNPMDSEGINALINVLPNTNISVLHLRTTGMRAANVSLLAQALPNCRALRYIDLSNNPFGNAGVTELIYMARNSNIEGIDVRDCFIDNTMFSPMLLESLVQTRITTFLFDVDDIEQVFIQRIQAIVEQNRGKPLIQQQGRKIKSSRRCRSCKRKIRTRK